MRAFLILAISTVLGCSGAGGGPNPDLSAVDDLAAAPDLGAFPVRYPRLTNHGGPVIATMELWTVVYPGDETLGGELDAFHRDMFATSYYWNGILAQYGVGAGTAKGVLVLSTAKTATLAHDAIPPLLDGVAIPGGKNVNTVLALIVPSTTAVSGVPAAEIAYHNQTAAGLPFLVLTQKDAGLGAPFESLTFFASHEAAEVATDPALNTNPAWYDDDLGPRLGEIADVCNPLDALIGAIGDGGTPTGGNYLIARLYHNQSAALGKDPCWHYPKGVPYFNVAVDPRVIPIAAGATGGGTLHVFSAADPGAIDWTIQGAPPGVTVTPVTGTNRVGDAIPFTVSLPTGIAVDFALAVVGTSQQTTFTNVWWFRIQVN